MNTHISTAPYPVLPTGAICGKTSWSETRTFQVKPVRQPEQIIEVARLAVSFALRVYRLVLQQYRPAEEENFNKKYFVEWRDRYFKEYNVELVPKCVTI